MHETNIAVSKGILVGDVLSQAPVILDTRTKELAMYNHMETKKGGLFNSYKPSDSKKNSNKSSCACC